MSTKKKTSWVKIVHPKCDLCNRIAVWMHPEGGLRCSKCRKPETVLG